MDFLPNEVEMRSGGYLGEKRINIDIFLSEAPGPRNERACRVPITSDALDYAFEREGIDGVRSVLEIAMRQVTDIAINELLKEYQKEAQRRIEQERKARKGPLGFLGDIAVALHEHRTGRIERDAARRNLPPDVQL
jgi:hypothetical protein